MRKFIMKHLEEDEYIAFLEKCAMNRTKNRVLKTIDRTVMMYSVVTLFDATSYDMNKG